jgi:exodeoxyribonuclease VII small subunit
MPDLPADDRAPSFESALAELEAIVHALEDGELPLDEALTRYEGGIALLKRCYALLEQAEQRIELLTGVDAEGNPTTAPFDAAATSLDDPSRWRGQKRSSKSRTAGGTAPQARGEIDAPDRPT